MSHGAIPGMLSRAELGDMIEHGEIETVLAVFPDLYGRFMVKRDMGGGRADLGARTVIADLRALKATVIELRGW